MYAIDLQVGQVLERFITRLFIIMVPNTTIGTVFTVYFIVFVVVVVCIFFYYFFYLFIASLC